MTCKPYLVFFTLMISFVQAVRFYSSFYLNIRKGAVARDVVYSYFCGHSHGRILVCCFHVNENTLKAHANEETSALEGQHNLIPLSVCARNTTTFVGTKYIPDLMQNTS